MEDQTAKEMLTDKEAAKNIGMSSQFLRQARCYGTLKNQTPAPPFYRIGRSIRYKVADLDEWLEKHRQETI